MPAVERCALCGASLGAGDRFCGDCGGPVGVCPSCGEPATPGKRFCRSCGAALTGKSAAPARAAQVADPGSEPVAERRVCSVLFCDMAGFTPLSESRWSWALAARSATDLGDIGATVELLALLDGRQPGHLAPMLRAERDLVRARLAGRDADPAAPAAFVSAIGGLRQAGTPYQLAHGLLDQAEYLVRVGDAEGAAPAIGEARAIAVTLRCQPLLARTEAITTAGLRAEV
jgi:double zinc ribbon protein